MHMVSTLLLALLGAAMGQSVNNNGESVDLSISPRHPEHIYVPGINKLHYCHHKGDPDPESSEVIVNSIDTDMELEVLQNTIWNINATSVGAPFDHGDKVRVSLKRNVIRHHYDIDICKHESVQCPTNEIYVEGLYEISPIMRPGKMHIVVSIKKGGVREVCAKGDYRVVKFKGWRDDKAEEE